MFTGIVSDVGRIDAVDRDAAGARLRIACTYDPDSIGIGASIACSGVCLTVVDRGGTAGDAWFDVEASHETLQKTTLGSWEAGTRLNLERSLCAGDELGGHIVLGHVDGLATITGRQPDGDSIRFSFRAPDDLAPMIAPKGSATLDGTSLTVNEVDGSTFGVNIVPHTAAVTTWGEAAVGDRVNLEVDVLARYVARLLETQGRIA